MILNFGFRVHFRDLTVYIGMHDRLGTSYSTLRVANGIKHPHFTSNAVRDINDIAVLTMNKRISFSDTVRPICLPESGWCLLVFYSLSIACLVLIDQLCSKNTIAGVNS